MVALTARNPIAGGQNDGIVDITGGLRSLVASLIARMPDKRGLQQLVLTYFATGRTSSALAPSTVLKGESKSWVEGY